MGETVQSQEELGFDKQRLATEVHDLVGKLADARKDADYEKTRLQAEIHALTNKVYFCSDKFRFPLLITSFTGGAMHFENIEIFYKREIKEKTKIYRLNLSRVAWLTIPLQ